MSPERLLEELNVTASQGRFYRFWLLAVVFAEALMLLLNRHIVVAYCGIATAFAIAGVLRVFRLYPGQEEPLSLDLSGAVLACLYALAALTLGDSGWRFVLVCCSSVIVVPYLIYIAREKL